MPPNRLLETQCPFSGQLRQTLENDVVLFEDTGEPNHFQSLSGGNTVLEVPRELEDVVMGEIVDQSMKAELEESGSSNWCRTAKPLVPLKTPADGNCLLHAISLFLWGLSDSEMFLRRVLYVTLISDQQEIFKRRWCQERGYISQNVPSLRLNTTDWEQEWELVLQLGDDTPQNRPNDLKYSSLEEIHLFVMANILKRPIIVLCDPMLRSITGHSIQPNNFGGIYLPLQWEPHQCWKHPIVLGYHMSHFSPLVSKTNLLEEALSVSQAQHVVPLVHKDLTPLRLHFLLPGEEVHVQKWLHGYLKVREVPQTTSDGVISVLAATLNVSPLPAEMNVAKHYIQRIVGESHHWLRTAMHHQPANLSANMIGTPRPAVTATTPVPSSAVTGVYGGNKCVTESCRMTGAPELNNMCSQCFAEFSRRDAEKEAMKHQAPRNPSAPLMKVDPLDESRLISVVSQVAEETSGRCHLYTHPTDSVVCASPICDNPPAAAGSLCPECIETLRKGMEASQKIQAARAKSDQDQSEMFGSGDQQRTPDRGTPEQASTSTPECLTEGCRKCGVEKQRSLCARCFLRYGPNATVPEQRGGVPPRPAAEHGVTVQGTSETQATRAAAPLREAGTEKMKRLCSKPGCEGLRLSNASEMCAACYMKNRPQNRAADLGLSTEGAGRITSPGSTNDERRPENEQLVESFSGSVSSQEVIFSDKQQVKCASPVCSNLVFPPKTLCDKCVETLTKANVKTDLCLKEGCKFHGSDEFQGYCSKCFTKLQGQGVRPRKPSASSPGQGSHSQKLMVSRNPAFNMESQQRSVSAPIYSRGKHCVVANCTRFGDPAMDDMCTRCYQKKYTRYCQQEVHTPSDPPYHALYKRTTATGAPPSRASAVGQWLVTSASPSRSAYRPTSEGNEFLERMSRVEGGRRSPKCLNAGVVGCGNYGSPLRQGYCSSCYDQIRGEDVVDMPAVRQPANVTLTY